MLRNRNPLFQDRAQELSTRSICQDLHSGVWRGHTARPLCPNIGGAPLVDLSADLHGVPVQVLDGLLEPHQRIHLHGASYSKEQRGERRMSDKQRRSCTTGWGSNQLLTTVCLRRANVDKAFASPMLLNNHLQSK